jgi:hypothetical protein
LAPASATRGLTPDTHNVRCGSEPIFSGTHECGRVTFTNSTSDVVAIDSFVIQGDTTDMTINNAETGACLTNTVLDPGESCFFDVLFFPTHTGHLSLKVTVVAEDGSSTTFRISGRGTA